MAKKSWTYMSVLPKHKVKIDREDLETLKAYRWRVSAGTQGRLRVVADIVQKGVRRKMTLGRFLMKPPKNKQVYPRRFNEELDYRKDNLIICTLKERQRMLPKNRKNNSSIYKGVSYTKKTKKWRAGIEVKNRAINLGDFKTEDQAALAYNAAAMKYFGKDTYQNPVGRKRTIKRKN